MNLRRANLGSLDEQARAEIKRLGRELESTRAKLAKARREVKPRSKRQVAKARAQGEAQHERHKQREADLVQQLEATRAEAHAAREQRAELERKVGEVAAAERQARAEAERLGGELERARAEASSELDQVRSEAERRAGEAAENKERLAAVQAELARTSAEAEHRQARLDEAQRRVVEGQEAQARIAGELADTQRALTEEFHDVEQKLEARSEQAVERAGAELDRAVRELADARTMLEEVRLLNESQSARYKNAETDLKRVVAKEREGRQEADRRTAKARAEADHERGRREAVELKVQNSTNANP
jgi:hypothetical protein